MWSIRKRFYLISGISIALVLLAAWVVFVHLFGLNLERRIDDELTSYLNQIAAGLQFAEDGSIKRTTYFTDQRFQNAYSGYYWQVDDWDVNARVRSRSLWDYILPLPRETHNVGEIHRYVLPGPDNGSVLAQERSLIIATPTGARTIQIAAAIDTKTLESAKLKFSIDAIPYLVLFGLLLLVAAAVHLAIGLKPLRKVSDGLDAVRSRTVNRLDGPFPEEVQPLVGAVNDLLASQEEAMTKARGRASDLAHGLKTPLTVLNQKAATLDERGDKELGEEVRGLVQAMERHINHELTRTRIAPGPEHRSSNAVVQPIVEEIVKTLKKTPTGSSLEWRTEIGFAGSVAVDTEDLREMLGNILENASKWAATSVTVSGIINDDTLSLWIEDDGPGIDTNNIGQVTDRGKRFDQSVPGSGIGLAIVSDIAQVYSLPYTIQNRQSKGLSVVIELPVITE